MKRGDALTQAIKLTCELNGFDYDNHKRGNSYMREGLLYDYVENPLDAPTYGNPYQHSFIVCLCRVTWRNGSWFATPCKHVNGKHVSIQAIFEYEN